MCLENKSLKGSSETSGSHGKGNIDSTAGEEAKARSARGVDKVAALVKNFAVRDELVGLVDSIVQVLASLAVSYERN